MKKISNLVALVMLVSTNVLTPFSYAQEKTPEVIPENEVGNVEEIGEAPEKDNEITGEIPNSLWEVEWEWNLPLVREVVNESEPEELKEEVEDSLDDVESPTTDENKDEDTEKSESDEVAQQEEENAELEKREEWNIWEEKENIETGDLLLKSLVDTELYAVDDPIECGSWYVLNADWTWCELIQVTFDANGWSFDGGEDTKTVDTIVNEVPPVRYSHTENINDNWVATSVYADNLSSNDVVIIPWATSLDIEVRFATEGRSYDRLTIYPEWIIPTASNYSSATISNGKLAWRGSYSSYTKPSDSDTTYHRKFTVDGNTAQFYFKSDSSNAYYGYYAIVKWIWAPSGNYGCEYDIQVPIREGYIFQWWYIDTWYTQIFNTSECLLENTIVYAKWKQIQPKDIVLEATATEANQTLKINKYFTNAYTVDRWDGITGNLTSNTSHTYSRSWTYIIALSTTSNRWTFWSTNYNPLVPKNGTTMTWVKIKYMPSLADGFGISETNPWDWFFSSFNCRWALTSLPVWSFNTSNIRTAGIMFFYYFNWYWGELTSLPVWSFNTSNITTVGQTFFGSFNADWKLKSLPSWSFNISKITKSEYCFFCRFNSNWTLTSLPLWSFNTSNITTVGDDFFSSFNYNWALTSLPVWSFNTSNITTVWDKFFGLFNSNWALTSLPIWSFNTSKIKSVNNTFFWKFNESWALVSLPEWSFNTSNIVTVGDTFFGSFNENWAITSLPAWSFNTSNIVTVWGSNKNNFFSRFNLNWAIIKLPDSFTTNSVWISNPNGYSEAFNSIYYTINKKVSDLVEWVTPPSSDQNTFSDNQPWRCGVDANWLVSTANACHIVYDANGWTWTTTWWYNADTTWVVAWNGIIIPTREWYIFSGWYDASWNKVEEVVFPDMDGHTLYANWTPNEYTITFVDWSWRETDVIYTWAYESIVETQYPEWMKEWYTIHWDKEIPSIMPLSWDTITASWTINEYTLTLDVDGTLMVITWEYGSPVNKPSDPEKNGYRFVWWEPEIPATMPAENMIIKASWEKNWYSGWWGGGWSSKKTDEDTYWSAEDSQKNTQDDKNTENVIQSAPEHSEWGSEESINTPVDSSDKSSEWQEILSPSDLPSSAGQVSFTKEQKDAYIFAKENWITTKDTIQSAQMNGKLTRIAMAKMLSQYAINVLWQTPDTSKTTKFRDVTSKKDADYDNGVTLAYQLWIMWQNMPNNKFRPNDEVTRAEFAAALSRMLYNTSDWEYKSTSKYYVHHMEKLKSEKILTNDNPTMIERRWYVMLMLMRSAK